jgi:hypothetical protein
MQDAEARLRMLNRDWDRINHARQRERDAPAKAGTTDRPAMPREADKSSSNPTETGGAS